MTSEPRAAAVEAAAQRFQDRTADDDAFKPGARRADEIGKDDAPSTPGQQTNDSGVNTGGNVTADGIGGRRAAPGTDSTSDRLDAATQSALDQLAQSRPNLRGPSDVFEAAAGAASTPADTDASARSRVGVRPDDVFGSSGTDGGAEHTADVVGQITSGTGPGFGGRSSGVDAEIALGAGLIGDQRADRDAGPSAAVGAGEFTEIVKRSGDTVVTLVGSSAALEANAAAALGTPLGTGAVLGATGAAAFIATRELSEATDGASDDALLTVAKSVIPGVAVVAAVANQIGEAVVAISDILAESAVSTTPPATKPDPGLTDPNSDNNPPTAAQIAFRQALKDSLGIRPQGSGDVDPTDDSVVGGASGPVIDRVNNNDSLIGQPAGPGSEVGGSGHTGSPTSGADVDPLEGSAFTGPALGGNPEDVSFGSSTLGLDAARRSDDDDDDTGSSSISSRFDFRFRSKGSDDDSDDD